MALSKKPRAYSAADRDRAARALLHKYQLIIENAPEILALIGSQGIIQYANPQMSKVLGYTAGEVEGRNIFEFIHPEDAPRAAQEYTDTVQHEGERVPSVLRLRDSSGTWIPFEIIANNRLDDPHIQAVIFTARDLRFRKDIVDAIRQSNADIEREVEHRTTELAKINAALRIEVQARRQAENELQGSISLLNATLDSTADGILVVSNERKITSCNRKFLEMWRLACDTSIGRDDQKLLEYVTDQLRSPNDFLDKVCALYANPSVSSFDILYLKDGRIYERYSQPQLLNDEIVGRVWSFRDVTQAKIIELELRQSQKMEALGRLAGGIAHEFNNLLMLISGYATELIENAALAEGRDTCEQILTITKRATAVTRQLLAFSRKGPDAPTVADLNLIVLGMERMLRRLLSDQVQLQISVTSDPHPVYLDVSQIEVMLMNLVINAQDAMPEGGLLSIATTSQVQSFGTPEREDKKLTFAVLQVSDTGQGIAPDVRSHIFDPFFTTKQLGKGTGLGLSTVFGITESAGGHIEVDSEPHNGATFRVYLPQVSVAPAVPFDEPPALPPRGGNETILLAEDESGIRTMTRAYLESLGYQVIEAKDGPEAIRYSHEYGGVIDLVLSDILMPGIRGDIAVNEIRKHRPAIKSMFMSGYSDQGGESGADNILYKPFEFPELGRRLRAILDAAPKAEDSLESNRGSSAA
ncbi:MAG TPA: PAS domain S-box protein [Clostridia bacterium]|nr:PAS domain S-box protein [Clostridia bacterium]